MDEDAREFSLALQRATSAVLMETPLTLRQKKAVAAFKSEIDLPFSGRSIKKIHIREIARLAKLANTSALKSGEKSLGWLEYLDRISMLAAWIVTGFCFYRGLDAWFFWLP